MTLNISFIGYQKPASIHNQAAAKFGEALTDRLGDEIEFNLTGDITTLGYKQGDRAQMVAAGNFALWYQSTAYFTTHYVPAFGTLDMPFIFDSQTHAYRVLDGALGENLANQINTHSPFHHLGFWDNGYRHFSNSIRPIRTIEDCQGMRVRTLSSPLHGETFRALGMEPEIMDIATLLERAAAGTIDAQDNPLTNIFNFGIEKVMPYITMTGHIWGCAALMANKEIYESWPQHVQDAIDEAAVISTTFQRELAMTEDDRIMAGDKDEAVEIIQLTAAERVRFVEAVQPVIERHHAEFGDYFDMIDAAR